MILDVTIRCLDCGRPVRALGGAWCEAHRPLDLTNGVTPADASPAARSVSVSGGGRRRVSAETLAEWRSLVDAGVSLCEVGRRYGRHPSVIRESLLPKLGRPRRVSEEQAAEWVRRYRAGESPSSIGDSAGVSSALCRRCTTREASPAHVTCGECRARLHRANNRLRAKRRAAGRCYQCAEQAEAGKTHCLKCLARLGATYRPAAEPKRIIHCTECGVAGHNAQTCLRRQVLGR